MKLQGAFREETMSRYSVIANGDCGAEFVAAYTASYLAVLDLRLYLTWFISNRLKNLCYNEKFCQVINACFGTIFV